MAGEPVAPPTLPQARAGDPITSASWNALVRAVRELQAIFQRLETQQPSAILVTVRDALAQRLAPASAVALVYAVSEASGLPTPPAERRGDGYRLANLAPGRYQVVVETTPQSGLAGRTQSGVALAQGQTAVVQVELFPAGVAPAVPSLFGQTLQEATALLSAVGLATGQVVDAHGLVIGPDDRGRFANRRIVSTEPGVDTPVPPGADGQRRVNLLVAGQVEASERRPRLVAQAPVVKPASVFVSPDGAKIYALSQGDASTGGAFIAVLDTRTRQVLQTVPLSLSEGATTPLAMAFHPNPVLRQAFLLAMTVLIPPFLTGTAGFRPGLTASTGGIAAGGGVVGPAIGPAGSSAQRASIEGLVAVIDTQRDRIAPGGVLNVTLGSDLLIDAAGQRLFVASPFRHAFLVVDLQTRSTTSIAPDIFGSRSPVLLAMSGDEILVADGDAPTILSVHQSLVVDRIRTIDLTSTQANSVFGLVTTTLGSGAARRRVAYAVVRRSTGMAVGPGLLESYLLVEVNVANSDIFVLPDVAPVALPFTGTVLSGLAVTPDGSRLCVGVDGGVAIVDTAERKVLFTVPLDGQPIGLTVTPDGRQLYVANLDANLVQVIDLTGTEDPFRPPIVRPRPPVGGVIGSLGQLEILGAAGAAGPTFLPGLVANPGRLERPGGREGGGDDA